jgi:hypothetical protein
MAGWRPGTAWPRTGPEEAFVIVVRRTGSAKDLVARPAERLIKESASITAIQVPHYWILDPVEGTLTVYRSTPDAYLRKDLIMSARKG